MYAWWSESEIESESNHNSSKRRWFLLFRIMTTALIASSSHSSVMSAIPTTAHWAELLTPFSSSHGTGNGNGNGGQQKQLASVEAFSMGLKRVKATQEQNHFTGITKLRVTCSLASSQPTASEVLHDKISFEKLSQELSFASPLEIMDRALSIFGKDIAIAFSGAEDVALIEYAHLTGRPFRVFSLDTGRLNCETYRFFADVENHYDIRIEYTFPDAAEVEALVQKKGLFSFYEDGHQECCSIRKVRPLKKILNGLKAWITGQRRDQSPGTRSNVPVVQVDPSFEGVDGGGSLVKWNPLANVSSVDVWSFLRYMEVPVNALHSQGYVSIGCEPCTRPVLPGQHEREGRWWWEDATAKECGLHKGNLTSMDSVSPSNETGNQAGPVDLFTNSNVIVLNREDIEKLIASNKREKSWLVALYAPWCPFCQEMEFAYNEVADQLQESDISVGKFRADGDNKAYAQTELQMKSFPTILLFSRGAMKFIKYPSERRDVSSLLAFVTALK